VGFGKSAFIASLGVSTYWRSKSALKAANPYFRLGWERILVDLELPGNKLVSSANLDVFPMVNDWIFAACAVSILIASVAVVTLRNPVRATLLLILSFLPTSLVYVLMHASFVGVLQILVYAGAIMMLFTFVIMMINPSPNGGETPINPEHPSAGSKPPTLRGSLIILGLLIGVGALAIPVIRMAAAGVEAGQPLKDGFGTLHSVGVMLFANGSENPLTISFELISFLILVGIVAALSFSRRRSPEKKVSP
jgi:NADH-quinone oxidoreductase subunit J